MPNISVGLEFAWQVAAGEAAYGRHEFIEPEHLFIGVCKFGDLAKDDWNRVKLPENLVEFLEAEAEFVAALYDQFHLDRVALYREARRRKGEGAFARSERAKISRSPASRAIFARASELAAGAPIITALHLLAALLDNSEGVIAALLREKQVDVDAMKEAALAVKLPAPADGLPDVTRTIKSPILSVYGEDLTQKAREGKIRAAIGGRAKAAMLQIVRTLSRATKNNPLLIGEPGVGKTAIVEGLAWRIAEGRAPEAVRGKRIIQVNLAELVAGTKYRGEFEERMQALVREVVAAPDVILFIDEIHTVVGAGKGEGAMDAANILKPALARGELRCIGATTLAEYRKHIEKDAALERRFQPITVDEPAPKETLEILAGIRSHLADNHGVMIVEDALQAAVNLSAKYLPDRRLPDKAIDVLDEACARVRIVSMSVSPDDIAPKEGGGIVTAEAVAEVIAEWTGVPLAQLTEDERARLLGMAGILKQRVIGQDEAVAAVAQAIQRARAGLKPAGRPIGVLLFLGPTGVGKTELARATAEFLFGSDRAMTQLDMSEFMEKHTVARLIGSPPGYVGYEEEGQLTGALRRRPFCVVLLDEIEKAHPDALNLFLQVFEDGRLTDAKGRTADATNALFIMTSNVGFTRPAGFSPHASDADRQLLLAEVKAAFRPEFLNRIDETIVFRPLQPEHIADIARLMLRGLGERLAEQGIGLDWNDVAITLLARLGYDEQYGARPLRRVIEQRIENPLGGMLLRGEARGGHIVVLDARESEIVINLTGKDTE